jgi:DNA invertase Pin-like site-specific DNA recombinase
MKSFRDKVYELMDKNYSVDEIARILHSRIDTVQFVIDGRNSISRSEHIRELHESGMSIDDIQAYTEYDRHFIYRVLYEAQMLKKGESKRGVVIEYNGRKYRRVELIRELSERMSRTEIAKELSIPYTTVYSALRPHSRESVLNKRYSQMTKNDSEY